MKAVHMPNNDLITRAIIGFLTLVMASVPFLVPLLFPKFRAWIREGIEGDNEKLDLGEIKELSKLIVTVFGMVILVFIIFTRYLFDISYPDSWIIYVILVILGTQSEDIITLFRKK